MQTTKVACPLCCGVFMVASASPIGKKLRCQKCGAPFTVVVNDICGKESAPAPPPVQPKAELQPQAEPSHGDQAWWVEPGPTAVAVASITPPQTMAKATVPIAIGVGPPPITEGPGQAGSAANSHARGHCTMCSVLQA